MWIKKEIFPYILLYLNFLTMIMNYLLSFVLFFKEQKLCPAPSDVCHQEILWATLFLPASQVTVMGSSLEPQHRSLPWSPQSAFSVSPELLQQLTRRVTQAHAHKHTPHTRAHAAFGTWALGSGRQGSLMRQVQPEVPNPALRPLVPFRVAFSRPLSLALDSKSPA